MHSTVIRPPGKSGHKRRPRPTRPAAAKPDPAAAVHEARAALCEWVRRTRSILRRIEDEADMIQGEAETRGSVLAGVVSMTEFRELCRAIQDTDCALVNTFLNVVPADVELRLPPVVQLAMQARKAGGRVAP